MQQEIEIKCLLGAELAAENLKQKLKTYPNYDYIGHKQLLNHYFKVSQQAKLNEASEKLLSGQQLLDFKEITKPGNQPSIRSRRQNTATYLIVKASGKSGDAVHGTSRDEFEAEVNLGIDQLDQILVEAGLEVLSKWSSYRDIYAIGNTIVEVQFSAGYGYVAELERIVKDPSLHDQALAKIRNLAGELGLTEADPMLLGKMFDYYNQHWQEYYGTHQTFSQEIMTRLANS